MSRREEKEKGAWVPRKENQDASETSGSGRPSSGCLGPEQNVTINGGDDRRSGRSEEKEDIRERSDFMTGTHGPDKFANLKGANFDHH